MYKKDYDWSSRRWNVFLVRGEKWDFIDTFGTAIEAQDYCDQHNCVCHEIAGDVSDCPVHGR